MNATMDKPIKPREMVFAYHERTKHHFERYAAGPDCIDWEAQPDPFRRFTGAARYPLPLTANHVESRFVDIYKQDAIPSHPLHLANLAAFFELSLGLSAWKQYAGSRWALRCNPSSGNLHPTEGYVILPTLDHIGAGLYHYVSHDHSLEQRAIIPHAALLQDVLSAHGFLIGLSSVTWREAWKYGERAFRYCQHDIGHAIAAIRYAAAALGWSVQVLRNWSDDEISTVLGINREADYLHVEREIPEVMLWVITNPIVLQQRKCPQSCYFGGYSLISLMRDAKWYGTANLLDAKHEYTWQLIDQVVKVTKKPVTCEPICASISFSDLLPSPCTNSAANIIRQRRSAQFFDKTKQLDLSSFYRILDATLPRNTLPPWDVLTRNPQINLVLFVHRVENLPAGLYVLVRQPDALPALQAKFAREQFTWTKPNSCPEHLGFYHLVSANACNSARALSCHQDIASDSAFSLGMISEFDSALQLGAWVYRHLFWEAGVLGHVLYLEAEAAGFRGTGIGCFFDDAVHNILGLTDTVYQSLYHFTIGAPLEDKRIETLPPYAHLPTLITT
jgi:SagB-type dehydrogenase family enzyme